MSSVAFSTIAQLLFADDTTLDFARIVAELDKVLSRLQEGRVEIAFDCDDLVTFDMGSTRIVLAWSDARSHSLGDCLTVSVGPSPLTDEAPAARTGHDVLCSRLVERVQTRFNPVAVLWCQVEGPIDAEVIDAMIEALPEQAVGLPPVDSILDGLSRADLQRATKHAGKRLIKPTTPAPKPRPPVVIAANDQPDLPQARSAELAGVRQALYPAAEIGQNAPYSTQMRLAVHCLNATLILVYAPLGAAVMTYSVLRGENMALTARLMAVTGTMFALAHSPVGQTVAAMARSIG